MLFTRFEMTKTTGVNIPMLEHSGEIATKGFQYIITLKYKNSTEISNSTICRVMVQVQSLWTKTQSNIMVGAADYEQSRINKTRKT